MQGETQEKTQDERKGSRSRSSPLTHWSRTHAARQKKRLAGREKLRRLVGIAQQLGATLKNLEDFDAIQRMEPGGNPMKRKNPPEWLVEMRENFAVSIKKKSEQIEMLKEEIINLIY